MQPGIGGGAGAAHAAGTGDDEAPKDPGARITHQSYTEKDYEGHRAHTVYVGVHLPGERRHRRHHKHHHSQRQSYGESKEDADNERPSKSITLVIFVFARPSDFSSTFRAEIVGFRRTNATDVTGKLQLSFQLFVVTLERMINKLLSERKKKK